MKKKIIGSIVLGIALISLIGITYSYFTGGITNRNGHIGVNSSLVDFTLTNTKVNVSNLMPIYDVDYESSYNHIFEVQRKNNSNLGACYSLSLVIDEIGENISNEYLKYKLEYNGVSTEGNFNNKTNGETITLITNQSYGVNDTSSKEYTLYIWLSYDENIDQTSMLTGDNSSRTLKAHLEMNGSTNECIDSNIPVTAYLLNNESTNTSYSAIYNALGTEYEVDRISCDNGSVYSYNTSTHQIELVTLKVPDTCTIYFITKSYVVNGQANNNSYGSVTSSSNIDYNGVATLTVTPTSGYYLSNASCTNGYTADATLGTNATSAQTVTISNNSNASDSTCTFTFSPRTFMVSFDKNAEDATLTTESKEVTYNETYGLLPVPERTGYDFTGWYTDANSGTQKTQSSVVDILEDRTLHAHWALSTYTVTGASNNTSYGTVTSSTVTYGGTTTLTITPSSGNYLSAFSCDNGYTVGGVNTGSSYTGSQTVTINNNNQNNSATCTATFAAASCTKRISGDYYWQADYNCVNGTGTMTACYWRPIGGTLTKCDGGSANSSPWAMCIRNNTEKKVSLSSYCNTSLGKTEDWGGKMSKTISCSCD